MQRIFKLIILFVMFISITACSEDNSNEELNTAYLENNIKYIVINRLLNGEEELDYITEPDEEKVERIILNVYDEETGNVEIIKSIIARGIIINNICQSKCDDKQCIDCINPPNPDYLLEVYGENDLFLHEVEIWLYDLKELIK